MPHEPFLIRSLVSYSPSGDQSIPAKGLNLRFGQVVAVLDAHDNNWWRACPIDITIKEDDSMEINMLKRDAGLIPSQRRYKRKILKKLIRKVKWNEEYMEERKEYAPFPEEYLKEDAYDKLMKYKKNDPKAQDNALGFQTHAKSYKDLTAAKEAQNLNSAIAYKFDDGTALAMVNSTDSAGSNTSNTNNNNNLNTNEGNSLNGARSNSSINTLYNSGLHLGIDKKILESKKAYDYVKAETTRLNPRPVMILGLLRDKLHSTLINYDPAKFAFVVPHTTREIRPNEVDGQDYHFITRKEMQQRIDNKEFIEAGVYKVNLYGTSVQAVRDIAEENKYALLDVSGGAINNLLSHNIDPIVILIKLTDKQWLLDSNQPFASTEQEAEQIFLKEKHIEEVYLEHCTSLIPVSSLESIEHITEEVIRVIQEETPIVWKKIEDPTVNL